MAFIQLHDKTAILWKDQVISYSQLLSAVDYFGSLVADNPSDKIVIIMENRPEWIYAFYGIWKKYKIIVPVDAMSSASDIRYILKDCEPGAIFCSEYTRHLVEQALEDSGLSPAIINVDSIHKTFGDVAEPPSYPPMSAEDTGIILYTSGTTGSPKGVMITFDNILANIQAVTAPRYPYYQHSDNVLVLLPLHHIFPLIGTLIVPLYTGATIVFSPSMNGPDIIATLKAGEITHILGVPRLYQMIGKGIKEKIDKSAISRLFFKLARTLLSRKFSRLVFGKVHKQFGGHIKYLVSGGAALDPEVAKDFIALGFYMLEGYGMTEAAPLITIPPRPEKAKIGSPGTIVGDAELKIIDNEVVTKGRQIMPGYYKRPEETADVLKDGWLYTGDTGYLDPEGFLFITGRKKEILVLPSGKNVNPEEIETLLNATSPVIAESAVLMKNNNLHAIIRPDQAVVMARGILNLDDYIKWEVLDKFNAAVAPYKKIHSFSFVPDELPRTRLGKLQRFKLADLAEKRDTRKDKLLPEPLTEEYRLIRDYLAADTGKPVHPDDHLEIDLGLDSLDKVRLQGFITQTFGIMLSDKEMLDAASVEKIAALSYERKNLSHKKPAASSGSNWTKLLHEAKPANLPERSMMQTISKPVAKWLSHLIFRIKVTGFENIPDTPIIIAPNHQSFLDPFLVLSSLPMKTVRKTYAFAKGKHFSSSFRQKFAASTNVVVMGEKTNLRDSIKKMASVLKQGKNILIFPEGTRTRNGSLGEFKETFAMLSKEFGVPVLPVVIDGAFGAWPRQKKLPRFFSRISISFLPTVTPDSRTTEDIAAETKERIHAHLT